MPDQQPANNQPTQSQTASTQAGISSAGSDSLPAASGRQSATPITALSVQAVPMAAIAPSFVSPPVPANQPAAEQVAAINAGIGSAQTTLQLLRGQINAAIQTGIASAQVPAIGAKAAIGNQINSALLEAGEICKGNQDCIELYLAGQTSAAWEAAAQAGATPPPQPDMAGDVAVGGPTCLGPNGNAYRSLFSGWQANFTQFNVALNAGNIDLACQYYGTLQQYLSQLQQLWTNDCPALPFLPAPPAGCGQPSLASGGSNDTICGTGPGNECNIPVSYPSFMGGGGNDTLVGPGSGPTIGGYCPPGMDCTQSGSLPPFIIGGGGNDTVGGGGVRAGIFHKPPPGGTPVQPAGCPVLNFPEFPINGPNPGWSPSGGQLAVVSQCGCVTSQTWSPPPANFGPGGTPTVPYLSTVFLGIDGNWYGVLSGPIFTPPVALAWGAGGPGMAVVNQINAMGAAGCNLPPPPPPQPPNAPPAACPPPTIVVNCGTSCPPSGGSPSSPPSGGTPPTPPPKPKPNACGTNTDGTPGTTLWCTFRRPDDSCYVVQYCQTDTTPNAVPENPDDTQVACFSSEEAAQEEADKCEQQQQQEPEVDDTTAIGPTGGFWCSLDVADILPSYTFVESGLDWSDLGILGMLMSRETDPEEAVQALLEGVPGWLKPALEPFVNLFTDTIGSVIGALTGYMDGEGCETPELLSILTWRTLLGFLDRWIGGPFGDLQRSAIYLQNYRCPRGIPSTADAQAAYLANAIDETLRDTWTAANGDCPDPALTVLAARRSKIDLLSAVTLYKRGEIDRDAYVELVRELGYIRSDEPDKFLTLSKQLPPMSEIIRMMVRDVEDTELVAKFCMDDNFGDKWTGTLKEWSLSQGVEQDFALREWRAHWSIPSPGQLYEMFHRYRNLPADDPLYVDVETVRTALKQQDILPYWVDKLLGTSFRLIPRSDLIQMTNFGTLDSDTLAKKITQLGYSDADSETYSKYLARRHTRLARTHPYTKLYIRGEINKADLTGQLSTDGWQEAEIDDCINFASGIRQAKSNVRCRDSYRKRFMLGEFDAAGLTGALSSLGYDPDEVQQYVASWQCERDARNKQSRAETLCKWFGQGLIDASTFVTRLRNIGYKAAEITNIVDSCQLGIDAKRAAKELQQQKADERAAEKAIRKAAQLAKQAERQAEKQAKAIQAMQAAAAARQKKLVEAAEYYAKNQGGTVSSRLDEVVSAVAFIRSNYSLGYDDALEVAIQAAKQMNTKQNATYQNEVNSVAESWSASEGLSPGPLESLV